MILPGHLSAGYVMTRGLLFLEVVHGGVQYTPHQYTLLLIVGIIAGDLPDIDVAWYFLRNKTVGPEHLGDHRQYVTHAPIIWLVFGVVVALIGFMAGSAFWATIGLLLWLGPWTHFLCDSIEYGVMWLWPVSKKRYALLGEGPAEVETQIVMAKKASTVTIDQQWYTLFLRYIRSATFFAEIALVLIALYTLCYI